MIEGYKNIRSKMVINKIYRSDLADRNMCECGTIWRKQWDSGSSDSCSL